MKLTMRRAGLGVLTAAMAVTALAGALPSASAATGSISGTVTIPADSFGVVVAFDAGSGSWAGSDYTSASSDGGAFSIPALPAGTYRIMYQRYGGGAIDSYFPGTTVESEASLVALVDGVPVTDLNFPVVVGGSIRGNVMMPPGATGKHSVSLYDAAGVQQDATLVDQGAYSLTGLAAGSYRVAFERATGFTSLAAEFYDDVAEPMGLGAAEVFEVELGQEVTGVDATLVTGGTASGLVLNDQGLPFAGVQVNAFTQDGSLATRTAYADVDGRFVIGGLSTGEYLIVAKNYALGDLYLGDVIAVVDTDPVAMTLGGNVEVGTISYAGGVVPSFSDVPASQPFVVEITWLAQEGISKGWVLPDGSVEYRPLDQITRDAMAAFMYRLAGSPAFTAPPVSPFVDVPTTQPFYKEITWLAQQEISTGWPVGGGKEYRPTAQITRDAMAAFMFRYQESRAGAIVFTAPPVSPFTDVPTTQPFYREITWLAHEGISTGWDVPAGKEYRPVNQITRDAMAAFMYRLAHLE